MILSLNHPSQLGLAAWHKIHIKKYPLHITRKYFPLVDLKDIRLAGFTHSNPIPWLQNLLKFSPHTFLCVSVYVSYTHILPPSPNPPTYIHIHPAHPPAPHLLNSNSKLRRPQGGTYLFFSCISFSALLSNEILQSLSLCFLIRICNQIYSRIN